MYPNKKEVTLFDNVTPIAITSSTDASPIVVTDLYQSFQNGDRVMIYGHTTNIAANGLFRVASVTSTTFALVDETTYKNIAGSGGGAGAGGIVVKAPPVLFVEDFRNIILQVGTSGTATLNLKVAGSLGSPSSIALKNNSEFDYVNMGGTVNPSNPYTFLNVINLDTNAVTSGATGLAVTGTDINNAYQVNVVAMKYFTIIPATWSAGAITVKALLTSNS